MDPRIEAVLEAMARAMIQAMEASATDGEHRKVTFVVEGGTGRIAPVTHLVDDASGWSESIGDFFPR